MRWHSVQTRRPSQPFSGKQLTEPLSLVLLVLFFLSLATPPPLTLPLAIVFTQTEEIYCQKSEGCARRRNCWCTFCGKWLLSGKLTVFLLGVYSARSLKELLSETNMEIAVSEGCCDVQNRTQFIHIFWVSATDPMKFKIHALTGTLMDRHIAHTHMFKHKDKLTSVPLMKPVSLLSWRLCKHDKMFTDTITDALLMWARIKER